MKNTISQNTDEKINLVDTPQASINAYPCDICRDTMEPTGETIRDIPVFRHQHKEKGIECQKEQCRKSMTESSNEVWKRIEENKKERLK